MIYIPPKGNTPLTKKVPHKKSLHFTADWFHHLQIYSSAVGAKILIPTHIHTTSITVQDLHASEDFESSLCTWSYPTYGEEMTKYNYVFFSSPRMIFGSRPWVHQQSLWIFSNPGFPPSCSKEYFRAASFFCCLQYKLSVVQFCSSQS